MNVFGDKQENDLSGQREAWGAQEMARGIGTACNSGMSDHEMSGCGAERPDSSLVCYLLG